MDTKKPIQGAIQFIATTPEEVTQPILDFIHQGFEKILGQFQPKQPTEYLTRHQLKEMLDVDLSTIHNWTKSGKLKSYGIGNRIYYKRCEIEKAIIPLNQ